MKRFNATLGRSEALTVIALVENYRDGRGKNTKLHLMASILTHAPQEGMELALLEKTYAALKCTNGNPSIQSTKDVKAISRHLKKNGFAKELVLTEDGFIGWQK